MDTRLLTERPTTTLCREAKRMKLDNPHDGTPEVTTLERQVLNVLFSSVQSDARDGELYNLLRDAVLSPVGRRLVGDDTDCDAELPLEAVPKIKSATRSFYAWISMPARTRFSCSELFLRVPQDFLATVSGYHRQFVGYPFHLVTWGRSTNFRYKFPGFKCWRHGGYHLNHRAHENNWLAGLFDVALQENMLAIVHQVPVKDPFHALGKRLSVHGKNKVQELSRDDCRYWCSKPRSKFEAFFGIDRHSLIYSEVHFTDASFHSCKMTLKYYNPLLYACLSDLFQCWETIQSIDAKVSAANTDWHVRYAGYMDWSDLSLPFVANLQVIWTLYFLQQFAEASIQKDERNTHPSPFLWQPVNWRKLDSNIEGKNHGELARGIRSFSRSPLFYILSKWYCQSESKKCATVSQVWRDVYQDEIELLPRCSTHEDLVPFDHSAISDELGWLSQSGVPVSKCFWQNSLDEDAIQYDLFASSDYVSMIYNASFCSIGKENTLKYVCSMMFDRKVPDTYETIKQWASSYAHILITQACTVYESNVGLRFREKVASMSSGMLVTIDTLWRVPRDFDIVFHRFFHFGNHHIGMRMDEDEIVLSTLRCIILLQCTWRCLSLCEFNSSNGLETCALWCFKLVAAMSGHFRPCYSGFRSLYPSILFMTYRHCALNRHMKTQDFIQLVDILQFSSPCVIGWDADESLGVKLTYSDALVMGVQSCLSMWSKQESEILFDTLFSYSTTFDTPLSHYWSARVFYETNFGIFGDKGKHRRWVLDGFHHSDIMKFPPIFMLSKYINFENQQNIPSEKFHAFMNMISQMPGVLVEIGKSYLSGYGRINWCADMMLQCFCTMSDHSNVSEKRLALFQSEWDIVTSGFVSDFFKISNLDMAQSISYLDHVEKETLTGRENTALSRVGDEGFESLIRVAGSLIDRIRENMKEWETIETLFTTGDVSAEFVKQKLAQESLHNLIECVEITTGSTLLYITTMCSVYGSVVSRFTRGVASGNIYELFSALKICTVVLPNIIPNHWPSNIHIPSSCIGNIPFVHIFERMLLLYGTIFDSVIFQDIPDKDTYMKTWLRNACDVKAFTDYVMDDSNCILDVFKHVQYVCTGKCYRLVKLVLRAFSKIDASLASKCYVGPYTLSTYFQLWSEPGPSNTLQANPEVYTRLIKELTPFMFTIEISEFVAANTLNDLNTISDDSDDVPDLISDDGGEH